jgi:hypothetical protein
MSIIKFGILIIGIGHRKPGKRRISVGGDMLSKIPLTKKVRGIFDIHYS